MASSKAYNCLLLILILVCISLPASAASDSLAANDMTTKETKYVIENGVVIHDNCESGSKLIDKMLGVAAGMDNYSANYRMVVYKDSKAIQEKGTIFFRKPNLFRIEVSSGSKKGSLALLTSDGKVHCHAGGVMKYFQVAVSPNSSLVRAINGYPMVGSDFYSLVQYLKNMIKEGKGSLQTCEPICTPQSHGLNYVLDMFIPENRNAKKPVLLKRIFVDPATYLPVFWQDYTQGKLWSESGWSAVRNNLSLPNSLFKP